MIKLIDWKIAVVGFSLPWLGFAFGCLFSKLCQRERKDSIAIAIETGIQNTGMAIFMLWFTLDHPAGDLAAVVPVAVATLTPFPLLFALIYYNAKRRFFSNEGQEMVEKINEKEKEATVSLVNSEKLNDKPGLENGESLSIEKEFEEKEETEKTI